MAELSPIFQCAITITIPALLHVLQASTSSIHASGSFLLKLAETCVKYAFLGLKLLVAIHEQGFLGM